MSIDIKQNGAANSAEETKSGKADNNLGRALKNENGGKALVEDNLFKKPTTPVFMRNSSEGHQGNAQDEKDETEE